MLADVQSGLQQSLMLGASLAQGLGWSSVLDITLVAALLYSLFVLIRQTRALRILYGLGLLGLFYGIAGLLHLTTLLFLFRSSFTVLLVAIPVVFQPELRAALERLGRGELVSGLLRRSSTQTDGIVSVLSLAVRKLSSEHIGALIVLGRKATLSDLTATGVQLDAIVSPELLLSIFYPGAPLHDGAVIIHGSRVVAASVFLPLSDEQLPPSFGTRHRAALGLSKETDAIVVVVSEETGKVSLAHGGEIGVVTHSDLGRRLRLLLSHGKFA